MWGRRRTEALFGDEVQAPPGDVGAELCALHGGAEERDRLSLGERADFLTRERGHGARADRCPRTPRSPTHCPACSNFEIVNMAS